MKTTTLLLASLFLSFAFVKEIKAQDLNGGWVGSLYDGKDSFKLTLYVEQAYHIVNNTKFEDKFFTGTAQLIDKLGSFEKVNIQGRITSKGIMYEEKITVATSFDTASWALKKAKLAYDVVNDIEILEGHWQEANAFKINLPCNDCFLRLYRLPVPKKPSVIIDNTPISKKDKKHKAKRIIVADTSGHVLEALNREVKSGITVHTKSKKITILIFDGRREDGDSISVIFNGKIVLDNHGLSKVPYKLELQLDQALKFNTLVFHAENLGAIPPNTAVVSIMEGRKKIKEIVMESDMSHSDIIYLAP